MSGHCFQMPETLCTESPHRPPLYFSTPVDSMLSKFGFPNCPNYMPQRAWHTSEESLSLLTGEPLPRSSQHRCCVYKTTGFQMFLLCRGKLENIPREKSGLPDPLRNLCSKSCFTLQQTHCIPPSLRCLNSLTLAHSEQSQSASSSLTELTPRHRSPRM